MQLLYDRIVRGSTLSEANGAPDPQFALPSTLNWMKALALMVQGKRLNFESANNLYTQKNIGKGVNLTDAMQNTAMEQLFFSLHQLAALEAFKTVSRKADISRTAIIAWYYGIYFAAGAMLAAKDGSNPDDHSSTAKAWDKHFAQPCLVLPPFNLRVSSLVEKTYTSEIDTLKNGLNFSVNNLPTTMNDAYGACCSYLSGTAKWYKQRNEAEIRESKDFKALGVDDFRKKVARELRDARLEKKSLCFIHQAFRYRGKANYREALFLGYDCNFAGYGVMNAENLLSDFPDNLSICLSGFLAMAGAFVSRRFGKELWNAFYDDIENHRSFTIGPSTVWKRR